MEKDWVFSHLDFQVRDMQELHDYYQSIGIGVYASLLQRTGRAYSRPPEALEREEITLRYRKPTDRPTPTTPEEWAKMTTLNYIGSLWLDCHPNPRAEVGRIAHIAFNVPDIRRETTPLIAKGCEIIWAALVDTFVAENIIDTNKFGNIMLQFRPDPEGRLSEVDREFRATLGVSDWEFRGMGIVVNDLDKLVEYYQFLGLGTFQREVMFDSSTISDFKVNGKTPDTVVKARTRMARVGDVVYEFVQPLEGEAIYKESLDKRGEGVNDLVFTVDDLDKETAKLVEKGVPVIRSGNPKNGAAFAYFDTRKVGDMMIKLIQA